MTNQLYIICSFIFIFKITQSAKGLILEQGTFRRYEQKYLANHVIERREEDTEFDCSLRCVGHSTCVSINYKISGNDQGLCELNNKKTEGTFDADELINIEFNHLAMINTVSYLFLLREKKSAPG